LNSLGRHSRKDVDGRDRPGHDAERSAQISSV
jgi:hypothetical protein